MVNKKKPASDSEMLLHKKTSRKPEKSRGGLRDVKVAGLFCSRQADFTSKVCLCQFQVRLEAASYIASYVLHCLRRGKAADWQIASAAIARAASSDEIAFMINVMLELGNAFAVAAAHDMVKRDVAGRGGCQFAQAVHASHVIT